MKSTNMRGIGAGHEDIIPEKRVDEMFNRFG
jgi:hypothetical protein